MYCSGPFRTVPHLTVPSCTGPTCTIQYRMHSVVYVVYVACYCVMCVADRAKYDDIYDECHVSCGRYDSVPSRTFRQ